MAIMVKVHKNSNTEKQDILNAAKSMNFRVRRQLLVSFCLNILLIVYIVYKIKH